MIYPTYAQQNNRGITYSRIRKVFGVRSAKERAEESAEIVRALIIGPTSIYPALKKSQAVPNVHVQLEKINSQFKNPESANNLIFELRNLDLAADASVPLPTVSNQPFGKRRGPIRAVCLDKTEEEAGNHCFAHLKPEATSHLFTQSVVTANLDSIASTLGGLGIKDLVAVKFDLGKPTSSEGILTKALPAETVMKGVKIQLTTLGYTTGQTILPDHQGVHPPVDRISLFTYWWGFELVLPPPTLMYLRRAQSISKAAANFLTAIASINGGIQEILPYIRFISQFIESEIIAILNLDQGLGVVCAAVWLLPFALATRPWDFDIPTVTPKLVPGGETRPPELLLSREKTGDGLRQHPSGESTPNSLIIEILQAPPPSEADGSITDNSSVRPLSNVSDRRFSRASDRRSSMFIRPASSASNGQFDTGSKRYSGFSNRGSRHVAHGVFVQAV